MKHTLILCFLLLMPCYVLAHPNHSRTEIGEKEAEELSWALVNKLVEKHTIERSWLKADVKNIALTKSWGIPEWIVTFYNENEKDQAKKHLYVFLSIYGEYWGVNHRGK